MPPIVGLFPFKTRLALWAIAQALPDPSVIRQHMHKLLLAIVAATALGVLIVLAVAAVLTGGYFYLVSEGLARGPAFLVIGLVTLALASAVFVMMKNWLRQGVDVGTALKNSDNKNNDIFDDLGQLLLNGFLAGLTEDESPDTATRPPNRTGEDIPSRWRANDNIPAAETETELPSGVTLR